jgi:hypothetical protein
VQNQSGIVIGMDELEKPLTGAQKYSIDERMKTSADLRGDGSKGYKFDY